LRLGARSLEGDAAIDGAWNFGPSVEDSGLPVGWVVERFIQEWGEGSWRPATAGGREPHEASSLDVDSGKAGDSLGWAAVWRSEEAVCRTAAWYRNSVDGEAAKALVDADIDAYVAAAAGGVPWAKRAEA
jgi:CDP-glucose 4,6-dehydratase